MKEVIKQAATVDEAIELALKELNLSREDVTAEVIDYPEKKLFFKKPAKVKVTQLEDSFDVKSMFKEQSVNKEVVKSEQAYSKQAPTANAVQDTIRETEKSENITVDQSEASAKARYSIEFVKSVIGQFYDAEYTLNLSKTQTGYIIKIVGEGVGCLIGRKGETMEALSYLTSLAANRFEDSEEKISVDVADYRQKREKDLEVIAKKMAFKVVKSGRPYTFEPMNPYERRIVHATIGEIDGVKSESKGEGNQRRVAIYSTAPRPQGDRPYTPRPQGDRPYVKKADGDKSFQKRPYNKDRKPYGDKPAPPPQKTREEKLVDSESTTLYSKIEL